MTYKTSIAASLSILFCSFLLSSNAKAGYDVGRLVSDCDPMTPDQSYCFGVINGISAMMQFNALNLTAASNKGSRILAVCNVQGFQSNNALRQIFLNWAKAHPKAWGLPYDIGVVYALGEAWPCQ